MELVLERRDEDTTTGDVAPGIQMTPAISEDFWSYRVRVTDRQAIVGFPKFGTIGIGFAVEDDWDTNLPYTTDAAEILDHISHNKGDDSIPDADALRAIEMISEAAYRDELRKSVKLALAALDQIRGGVNPGIDITWEIANSLRLVAKREGLLDANWGLT